MCMKYVNATTRCYKSAIQNSQGNILSLNNPTDFFVGDFEDGRVYVRHFSIQTEITILGTAKKDKESENPFCRGDVLHFTLRLTKCDLEPNKRIGYDIDEFEINIKDIKDKKQYSQACFPFISCMRVTTVKEIELPSFDNGKYVLKVLVRATNEEKDDTIQSMSNFVVLHENAGL